MLLALTRRARRPIALGGVLMTILAGGCGTPDPEAPPLGGTGTTSSASLPPDFYVDPDNPAGEQAARWEAEGRNDDAAALRKISENPSAKWLTGEETPVGDEVDRFIGKAAIAGQTPILVIHNMPERDCGKSGTGGAPDGKAYQKWIRDLASGVKGRPVTVILEPGAVADAVEGCVRNPGLRLILLKDAIAVLKSTSARVYLDAGHPAWVTNVAKLADALQQAGVADADGFALNVGNFERTADNVRYGHRISDALGSGKTFVIDTSRNGNGPFPRATANGAPSWCNPPGRALGEKPTTDPATDRVDALLWIKYPGESDGACRPGEPEAGIWWPEYALDLARRAAS